MRRRVAIRSRRAGPPKSASLTGDANAYAWASTPAGIVGARLARKAVAAGIAQVAFDRSGFRYHGRVKALADAAREAGLKI